MPAAPDKALAEAKRLLRIEAIARRAAARRIWPPGAAEKAMAARLAGSGLCDGTLVVSAYLAIGDEIDAIAVLARFTAQLALPVMRAKAAPLDFRAWAPGEPLVERMWGIREPAETARLVVPDVLLVPLLAFDRTGMRLGYGGGFFDRTLAALRRDKPIRAIGIAFDEAEVDSVPHAAYDERLDFVLTPTRLVATGTFNRPA